MAAKHARRLRKLKAFSRDDPFGGRTKAPGPPGFADAAALDQIRAKK